jgi:hypothetical protein
MGIAAIKSIIYVLYFFDSNRRSKYTRQAAKNSKQRRLSLETASRVRGPFRVLARYSIRFSQDNFRPIIYNGSATNRRMKCNELTNI